MQINKECKPYQIDLVNKHHLLGKPGFGIPKNKDFVITKITSNTNIQNIEVIGNGNPNYVVYHKFAKPSGKILIRFAKQAKNNLLFLGKNVYIQNGKIVFFGINSTAIISNNNRHHNLFTATIWNDNNLIYIGAHTTSNGLNLRSKCSNILIGEDCMIAVNVWIRNSDEHLIFDLDSLEPQVSSGEIIIYPHNWICQDVLILKNTKVGVGSIIGAKSLVIKDVPSFSVVGGNPSKIIKRNISWQREGTTIKKATIQEIERYKTLDY